MIPEKSPSLLAFCALLAISGGISMPAQAQGPRTSAKFSGPPREPPDRQADALHLRLEVAFDWEKKEASGRATHTFRALGDDLRSLVLDAVGIQVEKVTASDGKSLTFQTRPESLSIDLGRPVRRGEEFSFSIDYRCRPERGVYFRGPGSSDPDSPRQVWTQGETDEARHWIPCFDHPVDKLTTEVLVTAPEGMAALSNGRLVGEPAPAPGGGRVFHWSLEKPQSTYLIAVVVGDFAEYRDEWRGIPLVAYVPRAHAADAERSFRLTRDMCDFFSEKTGVPYPWPKYGQVCVSGFMFGGMENTSLTILTDRTLHDAAAEDDVDSVSLVAHELAHQWFGDLVTCRDWSDVWLNEGFATFFENLYLEKLKGWDEAVYDRMKQFEAYQAEDHGLYRRPLVTRRYRSPNDVFDAHAYPKGARILSMLRYVLGDPVFFDGIRRYLQARAYDTAETDDFRQAMEAASGRSLRWFFDQWVLGGGHPEFRVSSEWVEQERMVRVQVRQTQKVDELTALFRMPIEIAVVTAAGRSLHRVEVSRTDQTFSFPAPERPLLVRFDARDWVLKEVEFPRSREELLYQFENDGEVSGRIAAARELSKQNDEGVRASLLARLRSDPFWGVRLEAARALRALGGEAAREGLLGAFALEVKSPVRRAIVESLADYPGSRTTDFLRQTIASDRSYFVVGDALRALAKLEGRGALPDAYRALGRDSYQDEIRTAAIDAIARNESLEGREREEAVDRLLDLFAKGRSIPVRMSAGRALARLGRGSDRAYRAVAAAVDDQQEEVRFGAIGQLAELGDRRGIEVLRNRRGKEVARIFRNPLEAIDDAVKRLEGVGDRDQLLEELRRLRQARDDLDRRVKILESKSPGPGKGERRREF